MHSREEVLSKYFNIKPLFAPQAISAPEDLLNVEMFYSALPHTENVRAVFNSMHRASIAPNDAQDMFDAGATICATGIDLAVPAIRNMTEEVRSHLRYRGILSANAYCSPDGAGFSEHYDPRVVTVIQLVGTKGWEFSNAPFELNPLRVGYDNHTRETLLREHNSRVGTNLITLGPGDVLCLPAGTVHQARAGGISLSLNIAFDYIGMGVADIFTQWLRRGLLTIPECREPIFEDSPRHSNMVERVIEHAEMLISELRHNPTRCFERDDG